MYASRHWTPVLHMCAGRTIASFSVGIVLLLAGCAPSVASRKVSQGLVSIQSAVTCPAPPVHTATVDPPRHIAAPTNLTASRDIGYCAYIDTSRGIISVRLRPEYAPHAVADFVYLAQHGFYDGLSVYQTCPATTGPACPAAATVALAGDPSDTGSGGPGYAVAADPWWAAISSVRLRCTGTIRLESAATFSSARATATRSRASTTSSAR